MIYQEQGIRVSRKMALMRFSIKMSMIVVKY